MIKGVGIDIVEISRIKKAMQADNFIKRFFSEKEEEFFISKKLSPQTVAGAFAAKEAFSKALGTGIRNFSLKEAEVLHDPLGKPYLSLVGEAKAAAEKAGITQFFLSISHSENYAVATVTAEGDDK